MEHTLPSPTELTQSTLTTKLLHNAQYRSPTQVKHTHTLIVTALQITPNIAYRHTAQNYHYTHNYIHTRDDTHFCNLTTPSQHLHSLVSLSGEEAYTIHHKIGLPWTNIP